MMILRLTAVGLAAVSAFSAHLSAQQRNTLLFASRYNSNSSDAAAGLLGETGPFDINAVTPGAGASAFPLLPATGISAQMGDPDNDGVLAEFTGLPHAAFGLGGLFIKHADRQSGDASKVYFTVRVTSATGPKLEVFDGTTVHSVRTGDFLRFLPNGNAEFFMKQEHFVKAAGPQTGNWIDGATSLCQAPNGDLYYSPPNGISQTNTIAGGHWVNKPSKQFCNDGAIVRIPAADITYDPATGNVVDVNAASAIKECGEVGTGPQGQPSTRQMCVNSGAMDSIGKNTSITFTMVGLEIDPNGGTWSTWQGFQAPNLIFTFNNTATTCCGGPFGSWKGTVFSTARNSTTNVEGIIATINGVPMGTSTGMATGSWTGIADNSGSTNAPVMRGLALLTTNWTSAAPYGTASLQVENEGTVKIGTQAALGVQAQIGNFPLLLAFTFGIPKNGRPSAISAGLLGWGGGFGWLHTQPPLITVLSLNSDPQGRALLNPSVPNDQALVGLNLRAQAVSVGLGGTVISNPAIIEFQ